MRESLRNIVEGLGVEIRTGSRVAAINTKALRRPAAGSGGRTGAVAGVTLEDGETLEADVVIANRWGHGLMLPEQCTAAVCSE